MHPLQRDDRYHFKNKPIHTVAQPIYSVRLPSRKHAFEALANTSSEVSGLILLFRIAFQTTALQLHMQN